MCKHELIQLCYNEENFSFTVKIAICLSDVDGSMLNNYMDYMIQTHKAK